MEGNLPFEDLLVSLICTWCLNVDVTGNEPYTKRKKTTLIVTVCTGDGTRVAVRQTLNLFVSEILHLYAFCLTQQMTSVRESHCCGGSNKKNKSMK